MKFDMHVHTKYSLWSYSEPQDIIKFAKLKGLDGVAICDHNTLKGVEEFRKIKDPGIEIIPGIEIMTDSGEIIAYGVNELIPKNLSPEETIELIHKQGAVAVSPHPFDIFRKGLGKKIFALNLDGIEVFNSNLKKTKSNTKALLAASELGLGMTAGSDSHLPFFIGTAYSIFEGNFLDALNARKVSYFGEYVKFFEFIKNYAKNMKKIKVLLSKD